MELIGIDPGEKYNGYARCIDGKIEELGTIEQYNKFLEWIWDQSPNGFIVEQYRIRPSNKQGWTHQWSSVVPAKVIGAIEVCALNKGIPVHFQEPAILPVAMKMTGITMPNKKNQLSHSVSASLHVLYYWRKNERESTIYG